MRRPNHYPASGGTVENGELARGLTPSNGHPWEPGTPSIGQKQEASPGSFQMSFGELPQAAHPSNPAGASLGERGSAKIGAVTEDKSLVKEGGSNSAMSSAANKPLTH